MDGRLFQLEDEQVVNDGPVTCLGITFENDAKRREFFRDELRKKLPELRLIKGFPIGTDDDIIALSDPPYYTACPNPWMGSFIDEWERDKQKLLNDGQRHLIHEVQIPYSSDISAGKYNSIYFKHPYHTKVPIAAITEYLQHYVQCGDIVLDGFAGTGMTGVATQVLNNGLNSITIDLSPIASFINYYYNFPRPNNQVKIEFTNILKKVKEEYEWMYSTRHTNGALGTISSVIWSEVYTCPTCGDEVTFWGNGVDIEKGKVLDKISCPTCQAEFAKNKAEKVFVTKYDTILQETTCEVKLIPVHIAYEYNGKTYYKIPDSDDLLTLKKIDETLVHYPITLSLIKENMAEISRVRSYGYTYVHQLYFKRGLCVLAAFNDMCKDTYLKGILTSIAFRANKRYALTYMNGKWGAGGGPTNGTYYIPSLIKELNVFDVLESAMGKCEKAYFAPTFRNVISTQSSTSIQIPNNSIDYIFTDPPFGGNFVYSELNFMWESWLNVFTNDQEESITSTAHDKGIHEYRSLMTAVFKEYYRTLKPGHWLTVEFSNTQSLVWNALRMSLQDAGFIICNVATLDKQKGSFVSQTTSTAVKQDLVVTSFKPNKDIVFFDNENNQANVWDFLDEYLTHIPVHISRENATTSIIERNPKILFDRLIAYCIAHSYPVPMDAAEFQKGLRERYVERDGMFFTAEQAIEYEEKKKEAPKFIGLFILVSSEAEGIEWLKRKLEEGPKTYSEILPDWMQDLVKPKKGDTLPELMQILDENFLKDENGYWRIPDVNKASELEAVRNKRLLKEFEIYIEAKKIKDARLEALRAGFKECYKNKDFATIVAVGNKLPEELLTTDEVLLRFYDIASSRV